MKLPLYIHIPFCFSKCSYCDFFSIACGKKSVPDDYVDALCREIEIKKKLRNITSFSTVYIGGGTPSLLSEVQLKKILSAVLENCAEKPFEITIEANPDDLSVEKLQAFEKCGITRLSCGIQSLSERPLASVNRRSSFEKCLLALELVRQNWKGVFSVDLISALPDESEESFFETLEKICAYKPEHISLYSLTIEEETPLGKLIDEGKLVYNYEFADNLWLKGRDFLTAHGYKQYEVSNFCQKGYECRHNLCYWNQESYEGCGAGASSSFYERDPFRFTNTKNIEEYKNFWLSFNEESDADFPGEKEKLSSDVLKFEFFMMGLRKLSGVSEKKYREYFNEPFPESFLKLFNFWKQKCLASVCEINGEKFYALNDKGILFLNTFLEEL